MLTTPRRSPVGIPEEGIRCRFITSFGGAARCQDPVHLLGFCPFHFEAYEKGETNELGRISDLLDDQGRRRAINFHGVALGEDVRPRL